MLSLLALLRFEARESHTAMEAAIGMLMLQAQINNGTVIAYEHEQLALYIPDSRWGMPAMRAVIAAGREHGFAVFGAVVQPVGSTSKPTQLSDFTERTVETLLRLGSAVLENEIGISPKMMSLIQLSTPEFVPWFVNPGPRTFPVLTMS